MRTILAAIGVLGFAGTGFGQVCVDDLTPAQAAAALARHAAGHYNQYTLPEGPVHIPLTAHIVRRSDGSGGMSPAQLDRAMADLNDLMSQAGFRFDLAGAPRQILSDEFYSGITTRAQTEQLRQIDPVPGTINVYFVGQFSIEVGPMCGLSSFTVSPVQGIVMANGCAGVAGNTTTFAHEVAHYFDLYHTHETMFGVECSTGSNCHEAGDLVCDTPADPLLGFHNVNGGCTYIGIEVDPCTGARSYAPDVLNLMAAAPRLCRAHLTPGQIHRMRATLANLRPDLIAGACRADVNADGRLDVFDFLEFQTLFLQQHPIADFDRDGRFTVMDFLEFQSTFLAGCQ